MPGTSERRQRLTIAGTALAVLALAACAGDDGGERPEHGTNSPEASVAAESAAGKPNVIVVMTDDQSVADLEQMPRTRELIGEQGAAFANYFVSFPLCCPSRASYLTGRYAHNSGVLSNDPATGGGYTAMQNRHTLAVWLQRAGYTTVSVGRYLNFYGVEIPDQVPPGWSEWYAPPGPSTYLMYDYELNQNGELVSYGSKPADYQTDVLAGRAIEVVERHAAEPRPFFLSVTPLAPHAENDERVPSSFEGPRSAPRHGGSLGDLELPDKPSLDERELGDKPRIVRGDRSFDRAERRYLEGSHRRRGRSLLAVDELVERLVTTLEETGQLERTWILFTSDNGFLLGEHRLKGKITPYDEVVRVPLLVRGPGVKPGSVVRSEAANIDLAPTIAALAGAEPDRTIDGASLLPALLEGADRRRDILLENLDRGRVPKQPLYAGVRNRRYSYVEYEPRGVELYDMGRDPHQLENVAGDPGYAGAERRLARRLQHLRSCRGAGCR